MIFGNLEVHGAAETCVLADGAHAFLRVPQAVENAMGEQGRRMNRGGTGVELRFVITEGSETTLTLRTVSGAGTAMTLYYGDFTADWPETTKSVEGGETKITIKIPDTIEHLRKIAGTYHHRFAPDVIRLLLNNSVAIIDTMDNIAPPPKEMTPEKIYLAYGSSITHGSIALARPYEFANRIGEELGYDTYNYGFAGSACLEPEMAEYLASQPFDVATLEMGINILGIPEEEFEARVRRFLPVLADSHPDAKLFAVDVFYCHDDLAGGGKAARFRRIVEQVTASLHRPNLIYVNGLSILPDARYLTTGLIHPAPRGVMQMTDNLLRVIRPHLS